MEKLQRLPHLVESVQSSTPSARGATTIYKVRLRDLKTKRKVDRSFRGGETFGVPDVERHTVQFLYRDPESFHFMEQETYEQFALHRDELEWESNFLVEEMGNITAIYHNGHPIALELPNNVPLEITETGPGVKGNSATGRTKPALLETGRAVQVPEYLRQGERIKVDTRTGEFLSRA